MNRATGTLGAARSLLALLSFGSLGIAAAFLVSCSGTTDTARTTGSPGGASGFGGATTGGSTSSGGSSSGGAPGAGGGSSGGASSGGTSSGGASSGGAGGAGGSGTGGLPGDLCGGVPCLPTRCAGIGCGPAVCCPSASGPVCIHGMTTCPGPDGGTHRESLSCWAQTGSADFAKACAKPSDCFVAKHYAGCCRVEAIGLNASDQTAFDAFEQACGGAPVCGCCCDQVTTEDGTSAASGGSITVDCVGGLCTTRSP